MRNFSLLTFLFLLGFLSYQPLVAQQMIPNGGFNDWESRVLYEEFPPYGTTNRFLFFANAAIQENAYAVPGCSSPQAIRMENVAVEGGVQVGAFSVGTFGANTHGGLPYTDQPDSIYLDLRYDIPAGDQAIFALAFTKTDSSSVSQMFRFITGTQDSCVRMGFDIPSFSGVPDFVAILLSSGDLGGPAIAGGWIEIDSFYFSGGVSQLPNAGFEITEPLTVHDPIQWKSANDIQAVIQGAAYSPMVEEENEPDQVFEGSSALRITSRLIVFEEEGALDSSILGLAINGQGLLGDAVGGQPYMGSLMDTLSGQYRYHPVGEDTAMVYMSFFSYEPIGDSTRIILETGIPLLPTGSGYTCFQVPFELSEMPDSVLIAFGSSDSDAIFTEANPGIGSTLLIDVLDFIRCPLTNLEPSPIQYSLHVSPNPATETIFARWEPIPGGSYRLQLVALNGQVVSSKQIPPSMDAFPKEIEIPVNHIPTGFYFLSILNEEGDLLHSERVLKQ